MMSVITDKLSRRGLLSVLAISALVAAIIVAAPGISGARAAVKQFTATINPTSVSGNTTAQSFTVTITNCGGPTLPPTCKVSSTIQLGSAKILVPSRFTNVPSSISATHGWTASLNGSTIEAFGSGANKLDPGATVDITFTADVSACDTGSYQFTTSAWGGTAFDGEVFQIIGSQPTVSVSGCSISAGEHVTGPGGTDVTGNGFGGTVNVSFGGGALTCGDSTTQWGKYHLPDVVTIDPSGATVSGDAKSFTFSFPTPAGTQDSSFYLICYSKDLSATTGEILPLCFEANGTTHQPPCVSDRHRTLPPYDATFPSGKIVISILVPPEDPRAH
jgi:hypothetical protein